MTPTEKAIAEREKRTRADNKARVKARKAAEKAATAADKADEQ